MVPVLSASKFFFLLRALHIFRDVGENIVQMLLSDVNAYRFC